MLSRFDVRREIRPKADLRLGVILGECGNDAIGYVGGDAFEEPERSDPRRDGIVRVVQSLRMDCFDVPCVEELVCVRFGHDVAKSDWRSGEQRIERD